MAEPMDTIPLAELLAMLEQSKTKREKALVELEDRYGVYEPNPILEDAWVIENEG